MGSPPQDFVFWSKEDGLRKPEVVNMTVFLDDVNEFNGPLMIIPGSHKSGLIDVNPATKTKISSGDSGWVTNLTADLKYAVNREIVANLVSNNGIVAPKGPAGSVLLFDANVFHGSSSNMSPFDRRVIIVTYNSVANIPQLPKNPRPEFLVARDYSALKPLPEDSLA